MIETIFTIPEVAQYLKLSKSKVYHLVQTGQLPHIRIGKNVRVKESDLHRWMDEQSQGTGDRIPMGGSNRIRNKF